MLIKLIDIDYAKSTYTKYERTQRFVQGFIKKQYSADDIHIKRLDFEFATQLELWFKTKRKCNHNTTMKYISILNMIVLRCVANRWIDHDPYIQFEMSQEEKDPTFLMKEEVEEHTRDELGINDFSKAKPLQDALASAASFLTGGILPLLISFLAPLKGMGAPAGRSILRI
ncbi:MAG TPA: phage integrase SAM-like domain-containing protein [Chitinophagaceae bacterium]